MSNYDIRYYSDDELKEAEQSAASRSGSDAEQPARRPEGRYDGTSGRSRVNAADEPRGRKESQYRLSMDDGEVRPERPVRASRERFEDAGEAGAAVRRAGGANDAHRGEVRPERPVRTQRERFENTDAARTAVRGAGAAESRVRREAGTRRSANADNRYRDSYDRDGRRGGSDDGGNGNERMTNWIIAALAVAITILAAVIIFVKGGSKDNSGAVPTPVYVVVTNTPAPGTEPQTTDVPEATSEPTSTPDAEEPGYRYDAVRIEEMGKVCRLKGAVDGEAYIRRIVDGTVSWADADFVRLVNNSYYDLISTDSSGTRVFYEGSEWMLMDSGTYNLSGEPVDDPNAHCNMKIADCFFYSNLNSRKIFSLYGSCADASSQWNLVNIEGQAKGFKVTGKNYTESYSSDGLRYTITFNDRGNLLPTGQFIIDDPYFRAVTISNAEGTKKSVEFWSRKPMVYVVAAYSNYKTTNISAYEKPSDGDKVVFVDAGHGGIDWGACYTPEGGTHLVRESTLNLNIASQVVDLLRADGYKVYTTRDVDVYPGLFETALLANAVKADAFVSIHQNVDAEILTKNGVSTYYQDSNKPSEYPEHQKGDGDFERGQALAQAVHSRFVAATGAFNIGVLKDNWAVTRETTMPAILIECGFMTNAAEFKKLVRDDYIEKEAQAIYKGIVDYMTAQGN